MKNFIKISSKYIILWFFVVIAISILLLIGINIGLIPSKVAIGIFFVLLSYLLFSGIVILLNIFGLLEKLLNKFDDYIFLININKLFILFTLGIILVQYIFKTFI